MLEIRGLTIQMGQRYLFDNFDLHVGAGEIKAIMGPSGCGKSTLLAAIAGTLAPGFKLSGDILIDGRSIAAMPQRLRHVGIMFQEDLLFPHLNVAQNLQFAIPAAEQPNASSMIANALVSASLAGFELRDVATLSGGQRARISLLRSLFAKPCVLLLDEPFAKLDLALRRQFREFVASQIRHQGIPALLVSHDPQDCIEGEPLFLK
jgi:putative thiamine transport system ATP-binding protein